VGRTVLDGEIVALDNEGRPFFQALQHRASTKAQRFIFLRGTFGRQHGSESRGESITDADMATLVKTNGASRFHLRRPLGVFPE
jgi:hypothetical protein